MFDADNNQIEALDLLSKREWSSSFTLSFTLRITHQDRDELASRMYPGTGIAILQSEGEPQ